jgi:aspartyl-tRNA(Asn)/glutamyl-tRNA(Gln) amidotransferase subunit A
LCGVVGLKPTYGRVSLRGVVPLSWSLDHAGPLARSVEDAARLLEVIAGYDQDDPGSIPNSEFRIQNLEFAMPHPTFRVGIPDESFFAELLPETEAAVRAVIGVIQDLGFALRDVTLPGFDISEKASGKILLADAAAFHRDRIQLQADSIGEDVLTRLTWGTAITGVDYALARRTQVEWKRKLEQLFDSIDALVLPATPLPATPIDDSDPLVLSRSNLTRFTRMFNLTGNPALVLPCGFTAAGLPIGLQIVGPHWKEANALQLAYAYEQATEWHLRIGDLRF